MSASFDNRERPEWVRAMRTAEFVDVGTGFVRYHRMELLSPPQPAPPAKRPWYTLSPLSRFRSRGRVEGGIGVVVVEAVATAAVLVLKSKL